MTTNVLMGTFVLTTAGHHPPRWRGDMSKANQAKRYEEIRQTADYERACVYDLRRLTQRGDKNAVEAVTLELRSVRETLKTLREQMAVECGGAA